MIYQVRDINGRKLLQGQTPKEVVHFLRERPAQHYEVWILSDDPPSDLKAVTPAPEFPPQPHTEATE